MFDSRRTDSYDEGRLFSESVTIWLKRTGSDLEKELVHLRETQTFRSEMI